MNRKLLTLLATLSVLGTGVFVSDAEESATPPPPAERKLVNRDRARGRPAGWTEEVMLSRALHDKEKAAELGLSEEQIKSLNASEAEFKEKAQDLRKQLSEIEPVQSKLIEEGSTDEAAMVAAAEKIFALRLQVEKAHFKHLVSIRKTLTAEQSQKLKQIASETQQKKREPKGETSPPPIK